MKKQLILLIWCFLLFNSNLQAASFVLTNYQIQDRLGQPKPLVEALSSGRLVLEIKNNSGQMLSNLELKASVDNANIYLTNPREKIETFPLGSIVKVEFDFNASVSLSNGSLSFTISFPLFGETLVTPFFNTKSLGNNPYFIPNQGPRIAAINALTGKPKINHVLFKQQLDLAITNRDVAAKAWRLLVAHSGIGVYQMNPGLRLNYSEGELLLQQARQGNIESAYLLGALSLLKLIPVLINENDSHFLLNLAAEQNYPPAQLFLGQQLLQRGPQYTSAGLNQLDKAWQNGDARAASVLSQYYINAPDGIRNLSTGRKWLDQAVAKGDPQASVIRAELLLEGEIEAPNPNLALTMLTQAARNYNANAMVKLGYVYASGELGIPKDISRARTYYENAAKQTNDAEAMYWVGKLDYDSGYHFGAKYWLRKAAALNNGKAMYLLGSLYEKGLGGLEQSLVKQRYWMTQAVLAGYTQEELQSSPFDHPMTSLIPDLFDPDTFFASLIGSYLENLFPSGEVFNKCELISDSTQITLYAASMNSYMDSGIDLESGQMLRISATGQILFGFGAGKLSPLGSDDPMLVGNRYTGLKDFPMGCLLYKIGENGTWNKVGTQLKLTATRTGRLYFLVNDNQYWNNKSYFDLKIEVSKLKP